MIKKIIITIAISVLLINCDKKKDPPFVLQLGEPGVVKVDGEIKANQDVVTLDKDENIEFITEGGEAIIEHKKSVSLKPGDVIVANEDQRYILKVKEVREKLDKGTHVVVRQSNIEDLLNDDTSHIRLEATPKYDLAEIEKYIDKAKDQDQLITVPPTVDENGKIVVRNLELFSIKVNDKGQIQKSQSKFFGQKVSWRNKPTNFSFTAGGSYEAKINEMIVEIVPTVRNEMEWKGRKLQKMENRFDTRVKYKIDITYKIAGMGKMEAMIDLLPTKKIPLRVAGAPPVWLDIELSAPVGVSIQGSAAGESRVIYEAEYEFFATTGYNNKDGVHTDSKQRTKVNDKAIHTSTTTVDINAELFLKPNIMVRAYRIAGPYAYLQPYVRGELQLPRRNKKDDLFVGVKGGVGIEFSEPVFTTAVMSYESGEIFDFNASFDLDGFDGPPNVTPKDLTKNNILVDRIGNEGFVVINAKTLSQDTFARFELIRGTSTGILIPADDFYMSGNLHYYPLPESKEESFVIRLTHNDGQKQEVEIKLGVSGEVQQEVAKERFGKTTNSYKIAVDGPEQYADKVPHYSAGGMGVYSAESKNIYRQKEVLHSFAAAARALVAQEVYTVCRSKHPRSRFNMEGELVVEESFIKCLSQKGEIPMERLKTIGEEYRQYAYPEVIQANTQNGWELPVASVFDKGGITDILDIAMNGDCLSSDIKLELIKSALIVDGRKNKCIAQLGSIFARGEGDLISDGRSYHYFQRMAVVQSSKDKMIFLAPLGQYVAIIVGYNSEEQKKSIPTDYRELFKAKDSWIEYLEVPPQHLYIHSLVLKNKLQQVVPPFWYYN